MSFSKKNIYLFLFFILCLSVVSFNTSDVKAAFCVWTGATNNNWDEVGNWNNCGGSYPQAADSADFDGATSNISATINVAANVTNIYIEDDYTGTITQAASITVSNDFYMQVGTSAVFSGATQNIDIDNDFTLDGGTFTSTSGTLYLENDFLHNPAATFNHNNGVINFNGSQQISANQISPNGSVSFYDVVINKTGGANEFVYAYSGDTYVVTNSLTLTDGNIQDAGIFDVQGSVTVGSAFNGGTGNITITGVATRAVNIAPGADLPNLEVNGANITVNTGSGSGVIDFDGNLTITNASSVTLGSTNTAVTTTVAGAYSQVAGAVNLANNITFSSTFNCTGGTFNGSTISTITHTGELTIDGCTYDASNVSTLDINNTLDLDSGTLSAPAADLDLELNFEYNSAATFTHNNGTVNFDGPQKITSYSVTPDGNLNFYDVTINKTTGINNYLDIAVNDSITVLNDLTLTDGLLNGAGYMDAQGDVSITSGFDGGTGDLRITGATSRIVTMPASADLPSLTINGANISFLTGPGAGDIRFDGSLTITNAASVTLGSTNTGVVTYVTGAYSQALGAVNLVNDITFSSTWGCTGGNFNGSTISTITHTGEVTMNGCAYDATNVSNLDINNTLNLTAGTLDAPSNTTYLDQNFYYNSAATFNHNNGSFSFEGAGAITNFNVTPNGNLNFYNVYVSKTTNVNDDLNIAANDSLTVLGTLTLSDGDIEGTGYIDAQGAVAIVGFFNGGTGEVRATGAAVRDVTFAAGAGIPSFEVNGANISVKTLTGSGGIQFDSDLTITDASSVTLGSTNTSITVHVSGAYSQASSSVNLVNSTTFASTWGCTGGIFNGSTVSLITHTGQLTLNGCVYDVTNVTLVDINNHLDMDSGTFKAPSANLNLTHNFDYNTAATFTHNSGTVNFDGAQTINNYNITPNGNMDFYNVTINKTTNINDHIDIPVNDSLTVLNALTLTDGDINGTGYLNAQGNISVVTGFNGGTGNLRINGSNNQSFTGNHSSGSGDLPNIEINKSGGTLTIGNGTNDSFRIAGENWTYIDGTVDATTFDSTVYFVGTAQLDGSGATNRMAFDNVEMPSGTVTLTGALDVNGNLTINGGTLDAGSGTNHSIHLAGDWVHSSGTFTARNGIVHLDGAAQTINDANTFYNLNKEVTSATTLTFEATSLQTVTGTLTLTGTAGNILSLNSSINFIRAQIDPQGNRDVEYLNVRDNNNTDGTAISCLTGCTYNDNNINWNIPPIVTLSLAGSPLAENGGVATVTANLTNTFASNVTIDLGLTGSATNTTDYTPSAVQIVIAAGLTGSVTLTGVDDALDEINETVIVDITGVTNGSESGTQQVTATITDDDAPPTVQFTSSGNTTDEATNQIITAQLSATSGKNVSVPITLGGNATSGGVDYSAATIPISINAGQITNTVTVTMVDDLIDEDNETATFTIGSPTNATAGATSVYTATITDNDTAGLTLTEPGSSTDVTEGILTDTFTLKLDTQPTNDVAVSFTAGDIVKGVTLSPASLTFTTANWNTVQTVSVTAIDDEVMEENHTDSISHTITSSDGKYNNFVLASLTANITDNGESAGVSLAQTGGSTDLIEGDETDDYTIVLTSQPASDVTIAISNTSNTETDLSSLTFTSSNWNTPQTVTVSAVEDNQVEGAHTANITHTASSNDSYYDEIGVTTVIANITENSTAGLTVVESDLSTRVTSSGETDTYTIVLTGRPSADVLVTISGDGQVLGSPSTLTFTSANWATPQTVTLAVAEGVTLNQATTITHRISSNDARYAALVVIPAITVIIADDASIDLGAGGTPENPDCPAITCFESDRATCNLLGSTCGGNNSSNSSVNANYNAVLKNGKYLQTALYGWTQMSGKTIAFNNGDTTSFNTKIIPGTNYLTEAERSLLFSMSETRANGEIIMHYMRVYISQSYDLKDAITIEGKVVEGGGTGEVITQTTGSDQSGSQYFDTGILNDYHIISSGTKAPIVKVVELSNASERRVVVAYPYHDQARGMIISLDPNHFSTEFVSKEINLDDPTLINKQGVWVYNGPQVRSLLGYQTITTDLEGDGIPELIALMPGVNNGSIIVFDVRDLSIKYSLNGKPGEELRANLMVATDINGDGFADPIFGVSLSDAQSRSNPARVDTIQGSLTLKNQHLNYNAKYQVIDPEVVTATSAFNGLIVDNDMPSEINFSEVSPDIILDVPNSDSMARISSGDANGDSLNDIILGSADNCVIDIYFGSENIGLTDTILEEDVTLNCADGVSISSLSVGDVTGDGVSDIIVGLGDANEGDGVVYIIPGVLGGSGSEDFSFSNAVLIVGNANQSVGNTLVLGDSNDDGIFDIYTTGANSDNSVLINIGSTSSTSFVNTFGSSGLVHPLACSLQTQNKLFIIPYYYFLIGIFMSSLVVFYVLRRILTKNDS
ncbi:hypothetical protein BVY03_00165 [bacterium K02(2017)]|nr:hypothetical protein BVY03_00165 [bacterium K02(2017)]